LPFVNYIAVNEKMHKIGSKDWKMMPPRIHTHDFDIAHLAKEKGQSALLLDE
jgi:hypothetical protein